jgi:hypothetical protein
LLAHGLTDRLFNNWDWGRADGLSDAEELGALASRSDRADMLHQRLALVGLGGGARITLQGRILEVQRIGQLAAGQNPLRQHNAAWLRLSLRTMGKGKRNQ